MTAEIRRVCDGTIGIGHCHRQAYYVVGDLLACNQHLAQVVRSELFMAPDHEVVVVQIVPAGPVGIGEVHPGPGPAGTPLHPA